MHTSLAALYQAIEAGSRWLTMFVGKKYLATGSLHLVSGGLTMNFDADMHDKMVFSRVLESLLMSSDFQNDSEFAKTAGLSRQGISSLKAGNSQPNLTTLKKICSAFCEHGTQHRDLVPLIFAGLGIHAHQAFYLGQPYSLDYEATGENLHSRCILTDAIGECIHEALFNETLDNMAKGTLYFYFVPFSSIGVLGTLFAKVSQKGEDKKDLFLSRAYGIACPDDFVYGRTRIDNIEHSTRRCWVALGPRGGASLYEIDGSDIPPLARVLQNIVERAKLVQCTKREEIHYGNKGLQMTFEIIPWDQHSSAV